MSSLDFPSRLIENSNELQKNHNIKVLVCTANIGNEKPNVDSIREWIPNDGDLKSVLHNQRYPIRDSTEFLLTSNSHREKPENNNETSDKDNNRVHDENEKFQIIAIGMQEATFGLSENEYNSLLVQKLQQVVTTVEHVTKDENYNKSRKAKLGRLVGVLSSKKNEYHSTKSCDCENKDDKGQYDTQFLHQILRNQLPSYTRAVSYQRGQMRLIIFYKKDEVSLNVLSVKAQNTGKGGLANKGGIVAECDINSGTRISFLTAHLEAHEGLSKYNTRCSTILDIFRGTKSDLVNSYCDVSMTSHFTFAMGDLNFRTRIPNYEIGSDEHIKAAHMLVGKADWDKLNEHDELSLALKNKDCLVGFLTPSCDFPPTFKIERKDGYDYMSQRSPSYTDRILYKSNHNLSQRIDLQAYGPIDHFTTSDHKPIRGAFEIQLNQRLRFRPLLIKRDELRRPDATSVFMRKFKLFGIWKGFSELNVNSKEPSEILSFSFSSIGCEIAQDSLFKSSYKPSTCVSFISTPSDAMEKNDNSRSFINRYRIHKKMAQSAIKWPHTRTISNTLHPHWKDEINFKIRSHFKSGIPVDLTGAILHILVHDAKDDCNLIGSCSLNLSALIIHSLANKEMNMQREGLKQSKAKRRRMPPLSSRLPRTSTRMNSTVTSNRGDKSKRTCNRYTEDETSQPPSVNSACQGNSCGLEKVPLRTNNRGTSKVAGNALTRIKLSSDGQERKLPNSPFAMDGDFSQCFGSNKKICEETLMKNGKVVGSIKFDINIRWQ